MPSVNIPYVGVVQFPDTMSGDQISEVIRTQIMPNATRPVGGEQPGSTSVADRVQNVLGTQLGLVGLQDLVSKPSPLMGSLAKGIEGLSNFYPSYKASELDPIVQDRKAKYGQAYENAPPEKKDEFLRTEAKLNEYLGQMKQSQADVKAIEEKFGKDPLAQKLDKLQATPEYQKADAWEQTKMTGAQYLKNLDEFPAYAANIGLGSLPQSIAMALSARFGSVLGRTPGITAGGASSAFMEYGNNYIELREQGFTADEANKKAAVKSGIIGLFDAASIGSAGKIAERMFDGTAKKVLKETAKDVGKEVGKQAAFGAAGEGLGSYASNQPVDPRAIFEEAIGEIAGAPAEAAATYKAKREEAQAAARPAPPAAPTPAASPISTPPAPTINTVNGLVNPEDLEQPTAPPPPAINPELKQRAEMRVEQIEKGEAELNGRNVNPLARDLGIDVPKGQKPEETLNEVKQIIGLPTQPVEAPAAEVVHAVPMGTNTEYQVIKTPTGYTANLLDKDSGNYVPGSTRIFKTEVFGENAETKAMEFVVEEAKKAQPYMTPEEKAQTEAAPQEAAVQPKEPQIPEEAYYEPADELADIDYEELEQGLKAQAEQAKEEVAPKEEGAAPDAIPVLMGLQDAAFQNQAPKNARVRDWLSENGLIDVQGEKAKITPLGQKLNEQLNPVGIGAQPLTTEEANNIVKEFTHFNRPAKKEEAPKTQAQINQERQQEKKAAAEKAKEEEPKKPAEEKAPVSKAQEDLDSALDDLASLMVKKPEDKKVREKFNQVDAQATALQNAPILNEQVEKLSEPEIKTLEVHYEAPRKSSQFLSKLTEDIIRLTNEGAEAVDKAVRGIVKKLQAGLLSTAIILNPAYMSQAAVVIMPTKTQAQTVQVRATLPSQVKGMSEGAKRAYEILQPTMTGDKYFTIVDKPTATAYVFNPNGTLAKQSKVLLGKAFGDFYVGKAQFEQNRITPAGLFNVTAETGNVKDYDGRTIYTVGNVKEGWSAAFLHTVYTKESDGTARLNALTKEGAADSRYSHGCINGTPEFMQSINDVKMDQSKVFVVPDNQNMVDAFISNTVPNEDLTRITAQPKTRTIVQTIPNVSKQGAVTAPLVGREEEVKTQAQINRERQQAKKLKAKVKPTVVVSKEAETKAKEDLMDALSDLSMLMTKGTRLNMMPEEEQKLLPILTRLMDAAFRLGYHKFKQAAKYVLDTIRSKLGDDVADQITLDYLQGAYIGMAGRYPEASSKKEVVSIETLDELTAEEKPEVEYDLETTDGKFKVAQAVRDHFMAGFAFKDITEARKFIADLTGQKIEANTQSAKQADEAIEVGVVLSAQAIAKKNRPTTEIYDGLVSLYNRQPNLAVRSSTSIREQAYSTPAPLAYVASQLAGITKETTVYEPTAGNGMLLIAANPNNVIANELNSVRHGMLTKVLPGAEITNKNALQNTPHVVDAVIANPPFGAIGETWESNGFKTKEIDHAIVMKSLNRMKQDGKAVLIVGGVRAENEEARREGYRSSAKRNFYYNLYKDYNVTDHFTVSGDMYSKQGASYPVDVIVIDGKTASSRALPASDLPQVISSYEELKEKLNERPVVSKPNISASGADVSAGPAGGTQPQTVGGSAVGQGNKPSPAGERPAAGGRPNVPENEPSRGGQPEPTGRGVGEEQPRPANEPQRGNAGEPVPSTGERKPSGEGVVTENKPAELGGTSVVSGERVESGLKDRRGLETETGHQIAYQPHSQASSVGTLVPRAMAESINNSLDVVESQVGNVDDYVAQALNMDVETVREKFSAEQIDALTLAIRNAEAGKGFIIGDQTGIGKGRVVAAMIKYAIESGKIPIFVTEKPNLYSDMIRDLDDIGMTNELALDTEKPKIFITNGSQTIPYTLLRKVNGEMTENNLTLKAPATGKALDDMMKKMAADESIGDYKVIFTNYSQLQTVKGDETERQRFIKAFGEGNYMIFDESHNAGGAGETQARTKDQREAAKEGKSMATGRASFVRHLVENAFGTFFSSATYAKRPDVMDLYSSTDMKLAVDKIADLSQAIKNGGIPMQQIVANMLTQAGQYIRRERTFAGVSYNTVETKVSKDTAENMAESMRDILAFSRAKELIVKEMQKELDKGGAAARVEGERTTVQSANFGSIMHNLINQMLLSLKVEETVKFAIERIKAGEKPVITVANTMGSFLQSYAEDMGINIGDPVNLSFKDLYIRYLEKQRIIKIKKPGNVTEEYRMTDDDLGPQMTEQYNRIKNFINNAGFGAAPMSPIDYIHSELRKAGYKTEEITGRTLTLNYESGTPILTSRTANIKQRVNAVKAFNSGAADVIILNQAGSTGLSLHASDKVKDQRKRHMIIAQPEANIDTHMQMLGRVHRTGQVIPPAYSQMMADIPAEMRPAAILLKKMASLNANTTASRKSAVTAEGAVDFVNDYGGQVAQEYLRDNPDVYEALGGKKIVELIEDPSEATEGDIRKLSGYIPILPIKQQEEIYNDIVERYNDLIERENSMGSNKLEAKASDLDAKTISSKPITEAKDDPSVFAQPAFMERVDVKRTVKPFSKQEVLDQIKDNLNGKTATQHSDELDQSLTNRAKEYAQNYVAEIKAKGADEVRTEHARGQLNLQWQNIRTILRTYPIGSQIRIANKQGVLINGVITDIENKGKTKNPTAGSDWKMIVALANGDAKSTPIMFSQIGSTYQLQKENSVAWFNPEKQDNEYISVMDLFDKGATERREKRWMVTGNILGGFAAVGNAGQIMTYTKADGTTGQGVLMPRSYDFEKAQKDAPIRLKTAADAMRFINEARGVVASPDIVLMINRPYGGYQFKVPKSKKVGGTYFLDKGLTDITGDFYNGVATVYSEADAQRAIDYILNVRGETLIASSPKEEARKMFAPKTVALESIMPKESVKEQTRRIRNEKIREFQGLRQRLGNITRKFIKGEGTLDLQRNASNLEQAAKELQLDIDFMKERAQNLTPEAFYSKALKDYAEGNISKDVLDVVSYIYKKSPALLSGIKLSVRVADKGRERAAGNFNPIQRIISLFKGYGSEDASVLRHELMHSIEQMMTPQVREAIIDNWHQSLQAAMKKNTDPKAQKYFAKLLEYLENPNQETLDAATDAMPNHDFYQYVNPSEYWAVNAEKLMAAKMGTPWHRFVQFTKMLFEALKSAVGFDSRYPVYKAFNNLIKGEGERLNRSALAEFVMNSGNRMTFLEDIKKTDDLLQKHERPHAPIKLSNTALDAMMGGVQKAKDVAAKMAANPAQPIINMVGSLDRGILYTRIKNVWYGAGLEAADTERYNRQLRDSEGRAITSIAVNNALRAGHIGTQVMLQGRLQFNPITQMFQAVKDKMSLANVISLKHDLVTKIGAQRAADVIQAYFEAKRSRSINQEYSERSANLENLLLEQADPDLSVEKQLALIDKVEEAREDLRSIGIALQKVNMSEEAIDDFIALEKDYPELRKMMDNWSAVNKNMIDNMEFAKIISKQRADTLRKIEDYVPWYRIQDDMSDVHIPVGVARGLTNVGREKKFKEGRTELDIDDIVDNMIHNVMMITRNSLKNYAANRIAQEYAVRNEKNKIKVFPRENHAAGIVNILVNGRRINIQIADPLIAESVIGMENVIIPMNNILAFLANGLRRSITFSGIFQVKQLFMDAPTAALVSGVRNPVALYGGVFGSFIKGLTQSDPIVELLKSYGIGGYKSAARSPEHEAKIEIGLLNKSAFARATSILDKIADASDYAQRRAIYKRVLAETGDEMQAITQAANVIDFLKRGSGATSQFLNRTIAFMNAYAQQIDVLTQALAGNGLKGMSRQKALTRLAITGGLLAGTVLLYSMAVGDDDEYNKMDDQTKMRNFVIPRKLMKTIGYDHTLLIPMHTSASFFFKAIPELLYNKITKDGTKDAMDNTRLRTALKEAAVDSLFGPLMSGPIPTGIKAPVEIILNHNFFTGGTVTPTGMKNLEAFRQYNASTSELGKIVSKLSTVPFTDHRVLNPIEADHLMRGLAGSVAAAAMWGSNLFSNSKPAPEERDNIMYGSFIAPEVPRGREDLFYDLQQRSDTAMGTFKDLIKKGHEAEANQYFKDHEGAIKAYGFTSQVGKQGLVKINEEIRRLSDLPEDRMSPQEKREQINFYKKKKEEILEQTIKFRESAGL